MAELDTDPVALFVRVPRSIRKRIRQTAADEDQSMSQVVSRALAVYFAMPKGAAPRMKKEKKR